MDRRSAEQSGWAATVDRAEYVDGAPSVIAALFEMEPLYRALFATTAGRESHRRSKRPRLEDIQREVRDGGRKHGRRSGGRFAAIVHLISSSNGALFLKDYWRLDVDDIGQAMQWAVRVLADAARDPKQRSGL